MSDLIGADRTAFGSGCTAYFVYHIDSDIYEYQYTVVLDWYQRQLFVRVLKLGRAASACFPCVQLLRSSTVAALLH